ncbi:MAG TPA: isopentenyl-diphosphate Delta-isomerase, partial [Acidimicrobiales bacterium]|nr:isopentenyl-diphosphate Delta-isomerase [Acidimicrobiales bacterium]
PAAEPVVLLDPAGRPSGTLPKGEVHHAGTPLHLAFSCHVVAPDGRVLLTRRAAAKATWPSTWTNACCGHPRPGETLRHAVERRLADELGLRPRRLALAIPDFVYRAAMDDGPVEHELCPVVVAEVDGQPAPDPTEVDGVAWVGWEDLRSRAERDPGSLSPWSVRQIGQLATLAGTPLAWLDEVRADGPDAGEPGLDRPAGIGLAPAAPVLTHGGAGADADPVSVVRDTVEQVIERFLAERTAEAVELHPAVGQVSGEIERLIAAGGKRLRPAFAYWGHRATGAVHDDGVVEAAASLELLHTFALLHDDVMDRSARRRGRPTAHRALAEAHRDDGLDGDDAWFGVSGAVLAGDLAFLWANRLLDEATVAPGARARGRDVFARLCTEVIGGQYLDLRLTHGAGGDAGEELAQLVALLKSARYTVTRPLQLGAALADPAVGGSPGLQAALATYGDAVGLAFQLRDDVLGLFGDPAVTGKSRVDDLREGKQTLLVVRALALAPEPDRTVLAGALGDPDVDEAAAERCRAIVAASGAWASVEALIESRQARAVRAL